MINWGKISKRELLRILRGWRIIDARWELEVMANTPPEPGVRLVAFASPPRVDVHLSLRRGKTKDGR